MKLKKLFKVIKGNTGIAVSSDDGTWLTGWISPDRFDEIRSLHDWRVESARAESFQGYSGSRIHITVRPPKMTKAQKKVLKDKIAGLSGDKRRKLMHYLVGEEGENYDTGNIKAGASGGSDGDQATGRP